MDADELRRRVREFLAGHDPATRDRLSFLQERFDAGLAWISYPPGLGGLGAPRALQPVVDNEFAAAGAPDNTPLRIGIGLGMAAPTILRHGTDEQRRRYLRPLWTGEEVWCQLFSEPGAGSDLAALATRAVPDGDDWIVTGKKVWTSMAHEARFGILLARTDPDVPKHAGLTYFVCYMTAPGVEVRPLRQITGEAEFNEVFLTDVRIPDSHRLGAIGEGWQVARTTLMNERVAIGGGATPRESGMIGVVARTWRERPELRPGSRVPRARPPSTPTRSSTPRSPGSSWNCWAPRACGTTTGRCAVRPLWTGRSARRGTGTCARRVTRSRAGRPRSSRTSSPSGCSGCRPSPGSTSPCRGRTCPDERASASES